MLFERIHNTQSPLEIRFLEDCASVGLLVEPQYPVEMIHADFAIPDRKIAIECDSKQFHSKSDEIKRDWDRNVIYARNEYAVIRLPGAAIMKGGERIVEEIKLRMSSNRFIPRFLYSFYVSKYEDDEESDVLVIEEMI